MTSMLQETVTMSDLTNARAIIAENLYCVICKKAVDNVIIESDAVLLRPRLIAECHGRMDFIPFSDPRFDVACDAVHAGEAGLPAAVRVSCFLKVF
jgi:hypothetical protein